MDTAQAAEIRNSLEVFARANSGNASDVVSIKLRFLTEARTQPDLVWGEYGVIDPALGQFVLGAHTSGKLAYAHHESGPEIIGFIADVIGIAGGLYGAWQFIKPRILQSSTSTAMNPPFKDVAQMAIQVRRIAPDGSVSEQQITVLPTNATIAQEAVEAAFKQIQNAGNEKARG
jgi:hypothetical protein